MLNKNKNKSKKYSDKNVFNIIKRDKKLFYEN